MVGVIVNYLGFEERNKTGVHFLQPNHVSLSNFNGKEMKDKSRMGDGQWENDRKKSKRKPLKEFDKCAQSPPP